MSRLEERVAVVTGASSGIGHAIAMGLAQRGARLCLVGRRREALQAVAAQAGATTRCEIADLSSEADVGSLVHRLQSDLAVVDVLVHAAGFLRWSGLEAVTPEQFDLHYRTNLRAPFLLTRGLLPQLKACRGQVLFVNSRAGISATANEGPYAASKHGLKALADSLRHEVNAAGVRVVSLYVGRTATPMQAALHAAQERPYRPAALMQPQDVAQVAVQALELPDTIELTDVHMRPLVAPST